MRRALCLLPLLLTVTSVHGDQPALNDSVGWHWYNEPQEEDEPELTTPAPAPAMTPSEQKAQLQQATKAALDTAILYPTPQNFKRYMTLQNFWTGKAGEFSQSAKQAMLMYPELDYNLKFSHYNGTVPAQLQADKAKAKDAIARLTTDHGLFFFYRGKEPRDSLLASLVKDFCAENGISLMAISVDGAISPTLPQSRTDTGQAQRMGIRYFPALFLVNPRDESYQPVAYGFITPDDLSKQFLNVATGFKPNF
ncbi:MULTISPECIES: type-F conjugative transfer system pilin assembly protein TraF [Rahnella]|uniref:Type-F conjugative transfer system pilin assembly protein TraF n=1 Tax=Rahnella laticis TaxID=2787622 RepID=A0ABS0EFP6_9GAMM|nr:MULTISPECIES: type-F conjugative transfer system pilin assembly protein TraF [Rahnella]MBF7982109.1 type-F conjugative transfer system pilin assembly protein TraF [Rahnella laticis]MBF8002199.1 type-F conjugative transfer system pilin assembly protein TraF [Rahnella sp. LAC-M12]